MLGVFPRCDIFNPKWDQSEGRARIGCDSEQQHNNTAASTAMFVEMQLYNNAERSLGWSTVLLPWCRTSCTRLRKRMMQS
jgi:hypothetical protein